MLTNHTKIAKAITVTQSNILLHVKISIIIYVAQSIEPISTDTTQLQIMI